MARSPVASPHVLGHRTSQNSCRTSSGRADVAMARWGPGVHRRPGGHRPHDPGPPRHRWEERCAV